MGFLNLNFLLGILAWPLSAYLALMLIVPSGAVNNPLILALSTSMFGYPIPAVIGSFLFFKNRKKGDAQANKRHTLIAASGYIAIFIFLFLFVLIDELSKST